MFIDDIWYATAEEGRLKKKVWQQKHIMANETTVLVLMKNRKFFRANADKVQIVVIIANIRNGQATWKEYKITYFN